MKFLAKGVGSREWGVDRLLPTPYSLLPLVFAISAAAQETHPYRPGIDVLDYAITIDLPDTGSTIKADAMLTVKRTARVDTLVLDLRTLKVSKLTLDSKPRKYKQTDSTLSIPLPKGDSGVYRVHVYYGGKVTDGLIARRDSAKRWTYFGDNWPNRARYWIPSVDHPSDKATVTWTVRGPKGRLVIANGKPLETRTSGKGKKARTTTRWRENKPIPTYTMVIAAGPLVKTTLGETACGLTDVGKCVTQSVYSAPEQKKYLPANYARAGDIVKYFAQLVGPFPYEKLSHIQSSTRFGGMENASAIFYADAPFRTKAGTNESTIAHETAHQWFGDAVTEREWPHLWLSEGFATYFATLWTNKAHGDSAFKATLSDIRERILSDTVAVAQRPVIDTIETNLLDLLNRNSYEKGGFVLHMLRGEIGDSAFFQGLRAYYAKNKHSTALTSDLQSALEASSQRRLGSFFDQWLRRPGYPEMEVSWATDSLGKSIQLSVTQNGKFGLFEFPLKLALADSTGTVRRVEVGIPAQTETKVELPISAPVVTVEADPDVQLLARITVKKN